jgi:ligand-binding sensor domain-containing protein
MSGAMAHREGSGLPGRSSQYALAAWGLLLVLAAAIIPRFAWSEPVPTWTVFSRENSDLTDDSVWALAFSTDGSLWAGTFAGGLARLDRDGHWQIYTRANTKGGLPNNRAWALAPGPDGSLWVGTAGGGLAQLDRDGHWRTYNKANTKGGLPADSVLALAVGSDGALWAGAGSVLVRLDKDGHWQTYNKTNTNGGLPDDSVRALAFGPDGTLWVGTGGGLARLDKEGLWRTYSWPNADDSLPDDPIQALAPGSDGSLWAGFFGGLARLDGDGHWRTYSWANTEGGLPSNFVHALALGSDGALWAGTGRGLARLDKDEHWQTYSKANTKGGLPADSVLALALSPDGTLWAGTGGGLTRLDLDGLWQTYSKAGTKGGLPDDRIQAVVLDLEGTLWAGTVGGLARLDKEDHWQTYTTATTNGGLPADLVHALARGAGGDLWVGTAGGLAQLGKDSHWQTYSSASTKGGLPDNRVLALALGPDSDLWAGTVGGGLARLDKDGHWQTYSKASTQGGLPNDRVQAVAPGPDGLLWAGTGGGLARLDRDGHWQTYNRANTQGGLPDDDVQALAPSPDGVLWIGTIGGGLTRLDTNGRWETYSQANTQGGLPDDRIWGLALDPDGSLWVGTGHSGGLARLDKDGHWRTYSQANTTGGLPDDDVFALALSPDGSLWIGTFFSGLRHLKLPRGRAPRIVDVIGNVGRVTQTEQTLAVVAFDPGYLTTPGMFRYVWSMTERGLLRDRSGPEIATRSSVYRARFDHDGAYRLRVVAVDRYGNRSAPKDLDFRVTLPKPESFWDALAAAWHAILAALSGLYILALVALLLLTRRYAWAFAILSDAVWAKWLTWPFFFLRHVPAVQRWVLQPWFQAVRRGTLTDVPFLDPPVSSAAGVRSEGTALLRRLRGAPRLWMHGRSGMGKSSVFMAWQRAYFAAADMPKLDAAVRRYGFILIMLPVRHYAALPVPDANRPESWVLEAVRRQLEAFGFVTRDLGLIDAMLRAGRIALALDGTNEADRDLAFAAFSRQYAAVRLLVTSQAMVEERWGDRRDRRWEIWELPPDIGGLRDGLLTLWLGVEKGAILARRIVAEGLSDITVSGYDLRLLADVTAADPEHEPLPADRIALYRAMLARASEPGGQPLRLDGLKQLAWTMVTQRRRRIMPEDEKVLGAGTLPALEREGLRIVRAIGAEHEFRHDQMRAFLAALWLVEETATMPALKKVAIEAGAFALNRRDQEELWRFVAPLLTAAADLEALWRFANDDPVERGILLSALQEEADERGVTLIRAPQRREPETAAV